jgi:hypothetical protein
LARTVTEALLFGDSIPEALYASKDLNGTVEHLIGITGTFGPSRLGTYAGTEVIGWSWQIRVLV